MLPLESKPSASRPVSLMMVISPPVMRMTELLPRPLALMPSSVGRMSIVPPAMVMSMASSPSYQAGMLIRPDST